jgi:hypothetical protein
MKMKEKHDGYSNAYELSFVVYDLKRRPSDFLDPRLHGSAQSGAQNSVDLVPHSA